MTLGQAERPSVAEATLEEAGTPLAEDGVVDTMVVDTMEDSVAVVDAMVDVCASAAT